MSGVPPKNTNSKGTAVKKSSQIQPVDASALPERVSVAMGEIAENMHEGLLALAVGAGLQVMAVLMQADVTALAGPKGRHDATRTAVRHGRERGSVTLGGRRVPITRPRVRAADGAGELPVASYELFSSTEILGRMAMEKMLAGLSSRRYPVGLEPVGERVVETASATSKSAVSRKFVAMTETALAELLSRGSDRAGSGRGDDRRGALRRVLLCGGAGHRHRWGQAPAGAGGGLDRNATLVTELLVGLRERGLDVTRPMFVGIDGSKALRKAVVDVLDRPVIQRCQLHKIRNVKDHLPQRLRSGVGRKMTDAYHAGSALEAEAALLALATELDRTHPGAAASLREGLDETLTVLRLNVPPTLARTLRSTNCIESMISVCREHASNVKRWRDGQMALRWCAAGMVEAGKQFRRVNGHLHLPALRAALEREVAESGGTMGHDDQVSAA